jgi:hypothetical protein
MLSAFIGGQSALEFGIDLIRVYLRLSAAKFHLILGSILSVFICG